MVVFLVVALGGFRLVRFGVRWRVVVFDVFTVGGFGVVLVDGFDDVLLVWFLLDVRVRLDGAFPARPSAVHSRSRGSRPSL